MELLPYGVLLGNSLRRRAAQNACLPQNPILELAKGFEPLTL
jgi:hypothetical protein